MTSRLTLTLCATGLLAACGASTFVPDGPPSYKIGYVEGCMQGYSDGGYVLNYPRDEEAYETNPIYREGWEEGHGRCYEDQRRAPHAPIGPDLHIH